MWINFILIENESLKKEDVLQAAALDESVLKMPNLILKHW